MLTIIISLILLTIMYVYAMGKNEETKVPQEQTTDRIIREDGRIERVCKHGVGHPIGHVTKWESWMGVHGCDGCCGSEDFNTNVKDK